MSHVPDVPLTYMQRIKNVRQTYTERILGTSKIFQQLKNFGRTLTCAAYPDVCRHIVNICLTYARRMVNVHDVRGGRSLK